MTVVVVLVWAVVKLWPSGGDDTEPASAPRPSASSSAEASATPAPVKTQKALEASDTTTVSLPTGTGACKAEDVRVVPSVSTGQRARQAVALDLAVSTSAEKPCIFTAEASSMLAVISAGKTAVWDSSVCRASVLPDPVALSPQWSTIVRVTWNGRGSGIACSRKEGWATPGKYTLQIGTLGGEPSQTAFTLGQAVARPKPTARPTPTAKGTPRPSAKPSATPTRKPSPSASASPKTD
ncbi:hypothetical protein ASD11_13325 [Aeromicrobium sp. Root495]|nr:hypothetical protein ASD11_13325 [Aeromicrobium sp. Root495]